jgi:ATP-dependent DNA helicase RecG
MFSNRLEIHSPGCLPGPVNLANLLEARFSRNAVIAQVLSDLGFVERLGYGLNRVVNVMKENHLPSPKFEEIGGTFRVTLWKAFDWFSKKEEHQLSNYETLALNDRQKAAVEQLFERGRITNRGYQDLCPDVSSETIRRDLVELVRKGVIIKVGDKKSTYYILKN